MYKHLKTFEYMPNIIIIIIILYLSGAIKLTILLQSLVQCRLMFQELLL